MSTRFTSHGRAILLFGAVLLLAGLAYGQSASYQRIFPQSKAAVEKALRAMQGNMAGRLPALEGFAKPGDRPLDQFRRGYYQADIEVVSNPGGGSTVRMRAKVTAWYSDPANSHSGYELLISNGRLEADLLDQLSEQLAGTASEKQSAKASITNTPAQVAIDEHPAAPEPERRFSERSSSISSPLTQVETPPENAAAPDKSQSALNAEADNLEEILKNTAHPQNLVAVKKSGTPVVSAPSLTAKPQFMASLHDEFELLDFNADWVHVKISGLSRGWIWRNSVEMPEGIADTTTSSSKALAPAADLFHVVREETAPFPGDWEPLRGKNVKIISVQKVDESQKNSGARERLEFAKFLLEENYGEIADKKSEVAGIVLVFDSADGGLIGATVSVLQQWKAGALTDAAMWHKCFFDPPEVLDSTSPSGGQ
ncbi:MAG TPA: hypothetical protein VMU05_13720 [Dongiaceae bacterium]|nr:hypothetical protein [Dongiaceae bacterium]